MHITYRDKQGVMRPVDETLNDLLTKSSVFSDNDLFMKVEIAKLTQENTRLQNDFISLQKDLSDTKTLILKLQEQQNNNHITVWEALKKMFKPSKSSNITTSEVDLTK